MTTYYSPYKAAHHPGVLQDIVAKMPTVPPSIQVDLEAYCPHSCEFCSYRNVGWQKHGMVFEEPRTINAESSMPREIGLAIPAQMAKAGIKAVEITGGGESMVWPWITEFLDECARFRRDIAIVTNGSSFRPALREHIHNLKWIRFSMDAMTGDTHQKVHRTPPGQFDRIITYIQDFIHGEREDDTVVGISYVITPHNLDEIYGAANFYKNAVGADNIRYTFTYEPSGTGNLEPWQRQDVREQIMTAKQTFEDKDFHVFGVDRMRDYSAPNDDFSFCGYQHFTWAVGYNGMVYPCCIMKYHPGFEMGSLHEMTLEQIVRSDRRMAMAYELDVKNCKSCWLRDKNQFIEALLTKPEHVDFV